MQLIIHYATCHLEYLVKYTGVEIEEQQVLMVYLQKTGVDQKYKMKMIRLQKMVQELLSENGG